jgi:GNAT superfamily N-acetyltransferase
MDRELMRHIRAATNDDARGVRDLVFAVLREYGLAPDPEGTDRDLEDIEGSYLRCGGRFYVLEVGGTVLGTAGLHPGDDGACEIRKMYLHRTCRGRGIGRYLLEMLVADARRQGCSRVTLETASVLAEALELYRRRGFREYVPERMSRRCDRAMVLQLAAGAMGDGAAPASAV